MLGCQPDKHGSNQLGEIVTCQAMTTRPVGASAAAFDPLAPNRTMATRSEPIARRKRQCSNEIIEAFPPSFRRILHLTAPIETTELMTSPKERRVRKIVGPETRSAR